MTRTLLIACGAAETTGAVVAGGEIVRLLFAPARGDEALPRAAEAGDIVLGRIKTGAPALGGAFVDIGAVEDAFLPVRPNAKPPPEGSAQILCLRRPAIGDKGAVLSLDWKQGLAPKRIEEFSSARGSPRLLSHVLDSAVVIARRAQDFGVSAIVTDRPECQRVLAADGVSALCDERVVLEADIEDTLAPTLERAASLGAGARLIIDETTGGAVVDVDAGGAVDAARKPNDRVNERAMRVLFRELARRAVGGRVIVDFLPPSSPAARRKLLDLLETVDGEIYERRAGKLAPDGLFDMTAPRRDRSLLERAGEPAGDGFLRVGRRLTLDWAAKRAVAAVEARLLRLPRALLSLDAGAEIARYLEARPRWLARLADRYGARMTMLADEKRTRSFDVREI